MRQIYSCAEWHSNREIRELESGCGIVGITGNDPPHTHKKDLSAEYLGKDDLGREQNICPDSLSPKYGDQG